VEDESAREARSGRICVFILSEEESLCDIGGDVSASAVLDSGSREGNGVRNENELLEGEAKTIGPGEEGVVGDGGVTGEVGGESIMGCSGTDRVRHGGGRREAVDLEILDRCSVGDGKEGKGC
jgi:hypothetical protein